MKYVFKPSPNYRNTQTTSGIMRDLTLCLLAVLLFAAVYYGVAYGPSLSIRILLMAALSVGAALGTEALYFKVRGYDPAKEIPRSYGWVTALILVLITRVDVSYFAVIVATIVAIIIGKLVFGGFGQNIFNPAAFGEALIMNSFAASKAASVTADVFTGATPMAAMNSSGWLLTSGAMSTFIKAFGGYGNLLLGGYPSVIGGSPALLILLCGAFLLWRKDIDWHLSVTYLATVFGISLIVGLAKGAGISYAIFNVISGGVLFGTVFMMTDPVTTPITIPGRMVFAVGCAVLTLILRWKANLPDGVLFSILLMNMCTPAIDKLVDGNQIKNQKLIRNKVVYTSAVLIALGLIIGFSLTASATSPVKPGEKSDTTPAAEAAGMALEDFSENEVALRVFSNADPANMVYKTKAKGFHGVNEATITVDGTKGTIKSIDVTAFNDTEGVGDAAVTEEALKAYVGKGINDAIDAVSGATYTSKSIRAMAAAALKSANGENYWDIINPGSAGSGIGSVDFSKNNVTCREWTNTDTKAIVYKCSAKGFEGVNEALITVNADEGKIVSIEVTAFNDTEGVGDAAISADALKAYEGLTLDSDVDEVSGATNTRNSIRAMAAAALKAAAGN